MSPSIWFIAITDTLKLQALVSFILLAADRTFPLAASLVAYGAGFGLLALLRKRRLAVYAHVIIYAAAWCIIEIAMEFLMFGNPPSPAAFALLASGDPVSFGVMMAVPALFIGRGIWLSAKAGTHQFAVLRFDEGLAVFLCVFLIAAVLRIQTLSAQKLVIPYFIFSMIALGLSKREHAHAGGLARVSTRRMLVPVVAVVVLIAAGVLVLVPALVEPARTAAQFLKTSGLTALSYIAAFLQWLFGMQKPTFRREESVSRAGQEQHFKEPQGSLFATIMMYFFVTLIALVILALVAYLAYSIWKLLTKRVGQQTSAKMKSLSPRVWLARIFGALRRAAHAARAWWTAITQTRSEAVRAFLRLRAAGRAVGIVQKRTETPREYGVRLAAQFPARAVPIGRIVELLEEQIYGGVYATDSDRRDAALAARGIRPAALVAENIRRVARHAVRR